MHFPKYIESILRDCAIKTRRLPTTERFYDPTFNTRSTETHQEFPPSASASSTSLAPYVTGCIFFKTKKRIWTGGIDYRGMREETSAIFWPSGHNKGARPATLNTGCPSVWRMHRGYPINLEYKKRNKVRMNACAWWPCFWITTLFGLRQLPCWG